MVGKNSVDGSPVRWVAGDYLPAATLIEPIIVCDGPPLFLEDGAPAMEGVRLITCPLEGGVGHHTRGPGIEAANQPWVTLTNSDNYFVAGWLSQIKPHLEDPRNQIVGWGCLNNLWRWQARAPMPLRGFIDLSCVAVRTEIAKQVGFPFRNYDGDFDYIMACYKAAGGKRRVKMLPEILCVHN